MMKKLLKYIVWSLSIGMAIWMTIATTLPVSAQELPLSESLKIDLEKRLFQSLSAEERTRLAGGIYRPVTGLELINPNMEIIMYTIGNVQTTGVDSPLIIAEQYSTNCSAEPLERTFSFSKAREQSTTLTYHNAAEAEQFGLTGSAALNLVIDNVMERAEEQANFPIRTMLGILGGQSGESDGPTGTETTTQSESTQWQDSMSMTIGKGQIGRGRLLVTENYASIGFTQIIQLSGKCLPVIQEGVQGPPEVCFYSEEGLRGAEECHTGYWINRTNNFAAKSAKFKHVDNMVLYGFEKPNQNGNQAFRTLPLFQPDAEILQPPSTSSFFEKYNSGNNLYLHGGGAGGYLGVVGYYPEGYERRFIEEGEGGWINLPVPPYGMDPLLSSRSHAFVDLSKPFACFYPRPDYGIPQNYNRATDTGDWLLRRYMCYNAGMIAELPSDNTKNYESAVIAPGIEVLVWTTDDFSDEPKRLPPNEALRDEDGWYYAPQLGGGAGGSVGTEGLRNAITKVEVRHLETTGVELTNYFSPEELLFELEGSLEAVYQINARAEAVSEPATRDTCQCDSYPNRTVCTDSTIALRAVPDAVTVKVQGNGVVQYENYRYRDQVMIDFQENESITAALTAIPREGFQFTEWRSPAGTPLSGTYTPQPGETITAVFESDAVAAGRKTVRVEVTGEKTPTAGDAYIAISEFRCLEEGLQRRVMWDDPAISWGGSWEVGSGSNDKKSHDPGAYAEFSCDGDAVTVRLATQSDKGQARIFLNGRAVRTIDCYAQSSGTITYDSREKTVRLTAPQNPGGHVPIKNFTYLDDRGDWHTVPVDDPRVSFSSAEDWMSWGGYKITDTAGAYVEFSFNGKAAAVTLQTGSPNRGKTEVTLDGRSKGLINTAGNAGYTDREFTLYVEDEQIIRIENAGQSSGPGFTVTAKGFTYTNHKGEQVRAAWNDAAITRSGDWHPCCGSNPGTIYTDTPGAYSEFIGKDVVVHTSTGRNRGFARFYVDGKLKQELDLHRPTDNYQVIDVDLSE